LRLHAPHIGATALPVEVEHGNSLPDGTAAVSATASRTDDRLAITLINRHYDHGASVRLTCDASGQARGQLLTADSPRAVNSPDQPDAVVPVALAVGGDRAGWHVDLPPHSLATVVIRSR
jgi:alpha-N-arabinofuranosidase